MQKIIKELIENISFKEDDTIHFPKKGYTPLIISKNNFHDIKKTDSNKKIMFIDGGNQEIIGASNFSYSFIRVCACIYQNNKRIDEKNIETNCLITTKKINDKLVYNAKLDDMEYNFDIYDKTLSVGDHKVNIEKIGDTVRKFLEVIMATNLIEENAIITLDRDLEISTTGEKELFDKLMQKALNNNAVVCGITKTNTLFTESGNSLPAMLQNISDKDSWYYHPIVRIEESLADMYILKLHDKSDYVFRLDIIGNANEVISILAKNSKDPAFLGYPYGLVWADKRARVSNKEKEIMQTQMFVKFGKDFKKIKAYLNTKNAHGVLDNIG